jgi:diguanylate cyclase (GGDEF)-like protein/PAS domain S-box-containing protein
LEAENGSINWAELANDYLEKNLPLGVLVVDASGIIRLWNSWLEIQSGLSAETTVGRPLLEIIPGEQGRKVAETLRRVQESGQVLVLAQRFHKYLIPIPLKEPSAPFPFMQQNSQIAPLWWKGEIVGAIVLIQDVTEAVLREQELRRQIEEEEAMNQSLQQREKEIRRVKEEWERTFDAVPDLVAILDSDHRVVRVNKAMADRLGVTPEEAVGVHCYEAVHGLSAPPPFCPHARMLKTGEYVSVDLYEERLKGYFQVNVVPLYDEKGGLIGSVHIAHDITERKQLTDLLERLSYQDGLTGIANRRKFDEAMQLEWRRAKRGQVSLSLIMVGIDFFKKFNDRYGHQAGDDCLKEIARTLQETIHRPGDVAARFGGEEFAVLLPQTSKEGAASVAEVIRTRIEGLKITHLDSSVSPYITVSLGVATLVPNEQTQATDLISAADRALYRAKREGRNRVAVY